MCTEGDLSDLGGVGDNLGEVSAEAVFQAAKCLGQLCVQPLDGSPGVDICADQLVVSASVVKVPIAVEVETQLADGRLDPRGRVILTAADRSPGPVGFSLYQDDVDVSIRDLVVAMLTISDNPATDALLQIVGLVPLLWARLLPGGFLPIEEAIADGLRGGENPALAGVLADFLG